MDEQCKGVKKCLKFFNPEHFPGLSWGTPWEYRDFLGCCCDCQVEKRMRYEREADICTSIWTTSKRLQRMREEDKEKERKYYEENIADQEGWVE